MQADPGTEDERSIANRLANEEKKDDNEDDSLETQRLKKDPTLPVSYAGVQTDARGIWS